MDKRDKKIDSLNGDLGDLFSNIYESETEAIDIRLAENERIPIGSKINCGILFYAGDSPVNCTMYGFTPTGSYTRLGDFRSINEIKTIEITEEYSMVRFYFNRVSENFLKKAYFRIINESDVDVSNIVEQLWNTNGKISSDVSELFDTASKHTSEIDELRDFTGIKNKLTMKKITHQVTNNQWDLINFGLKKDIEYSISVKSPNSRVIQMYTKGFQFMCQFNGSSTNVVKVDSDQDECYFYTGGSEVPYEIEITIESGKKTTLNTDFKVLILGDSYSEIGNWINMLKTYINMSHIVNIGVSSATLKDKYTDRATYPYTSNPSMQNSSGNLNVFACQIEKLKSLMGGQNPIYATEESHPNVIFIEGGTNDNADSNVDYKDILFERKQCYVKYGNDDVRNENAYIKKDVDEIDRTTFVGALAYIYTELHRMFPNAMIFLIPPCGFSYPNGNNMNYIEKNEQMLLAAKYLGINVINWLQGGQTQYMQEIDGDGTQENPYVLNDTRYTNDWLHPNNTSGDALAREVAKTLRMYFE